MSETYSTYGQNIIMGKNSNNMNANAIGNRGRTVTQDSAISTGLNSLAENDVTMDQEEGQDMDLNGIVSVSGGRCICVLFELFLGRCFITSCEIKSCHA